MKYTSIDIIYNPNSTGPSAKYAKDLKQDLQKHFRDLKINLRKTKYAGHAERLAYICAHASKRPLIISSSGDGGYNEVVNGAIKAQLEGARPICTVLAAGNANDHSRTIQNQSLFSAIKSGKTRSLDLLRASYIQSGTKKVRYAHSYIGFGLTPIVATELNKTDLNAVKELWLVLKTFYKFRPFKIQHNGTQKVLDSILFSNIGKMAKVLSISKNAQPDDGKFEIITFPHSHKFHLFGRLAKAVVTGLEQSNHYKKYGFKVLKKTPVQFDGEVEFIDKDSPVEITSEHLLLTTVF